MFVDNLVDGLFEFLVMHPMRSLDVTRCSEGVALGCLILPWTSFLMVFVSVEVLEDKGWNNLNNPELIRYFLILVSK